MLKNKFRGLQLSLMAALITGGVTTAVLPANADTPPLANMRDNAHIVLSGQVGDIRSDEFDLVYGADQVTVELDRFGWDEGATAYLAPGETVTVSGYVDNDLLEGHEIEAYNVRLHDSLVMYYTVEPYQDQNGFLTSDLRDGTFVTMDGVITAIEGREFVVTNEDSQMRVDTAGLAYDPFDMQGLQRLQLGDRVSVYGEIDNDFFDSREIMASNVLEMQSFMN